MAPDSKNIKIEIILSLFIFKYINEITAFQNFAFLQQEITYF